MKTGLVHFDYNEVEFSNTTTETEIFRFDFAELQSLSGGENGGLLGPNRAAKITVWGRSGQNIGSGTHSTLFKAVIGTENIGQSNADIPQGYPYYQMSWTIFAPTATNRVFVRREFFVGDTTPNSGEAGLTISHTDKIIDLSEDSTVIVTAQMGTANAAFEVFQKGATVEFL